MALPRSVLSFAALALVLLLVGNSLQLGTLWVNQIWGNSDTRFVNVEDVRIDDNTMYVDFVNQLGTAGVSVEQTVFQAGSVRVPVNLQVDQVGTVQGRLNANGGIYADDAVNGGFSFTVEDNTGITTIAGELRPNGGINVDGGRFTVSTTGETIIDTAPLRPNGGIDSNFGQFTVNKDDGSVLTKGQLSVHQDVVLGTSAEENRFVRRVPSTSRTGGNTHIRGQDGIVNGGSLEFLPGYANIGTNHGQIVFGRAQPDDLLITRSDVSVAGGTTTFAGQSSTAARGGDLLLRAGSTTSTTSAGGNIVLVPGFASIGGGNGDIVLGGSNDVNAPEFDLTVRRPDAVLQNAGTTTFSGQTSLLGNGGDFVVAGGNGRTGALANGVPVGGDVVLLPGIGTNVYGKIILGRNDNDDLFVTRMSSVADAGVTYFKGQDSSLGRGGDVRIIAGDAATDPNANAAAGPTQNGGDIHLVTGLATNGGLPGSIFWGVKDQALEVRRETQTAATTGSATSIFGQNSAIARGGDLNLFSGTGPAGSGNVVVQVPAGAAASRAGTISFLAGDTTVVGARGGDIRIFAGTAAEGSGGVVSITAGAGAVGGNILLQAGAGGAAAVPPNSGGKVIVKSGASLFLVDRAPVIIENGNLVLTRGGTDRVTLSADPSAILTVNGNVILKSRITGTVSGDANTAITLVGPLDLGDTRRVDLYLADLQSSLNSVIRALSPCGHGLFNIYDPVTKTAVTNSAAAICTRATNKRRSLATVSSDGVDPLSKDLRARIQCGANSAALATVPAAVTNQLAVRGAGTSFSTKSALTCNGIACSENLPPLAFLVNDQNQRKCLMNNDAVSGPEVNNAVPNQITTSLGVLAAGYVHDRTEDPNTI